jgi:hypothetical protein
VAFLFSILALVAVPMIAFLIKVLEFVGMENVSVMGMSLFFERLN